MTAVATSVTIAPKTSFVVETFSTTVIWKNRYKITVHRSYRKQLS